MQENDGCDDIDSTLQCIELIFSMDTRALGDENVNFLVNLLDSGHSYEVVILLAKLQPALRFGGSNENEIENETDSSVSLIHLLCAHQKFPDRLIRDLLDLDWYILSQKENEECEAATADVTNGFKKKMALKKFVEESNLNFDFIKDAYKRFQKSVDLTSAHNAHLINYEGICSLLQLKDSSLQEVFQLYSYEHHAEIDVKEFFVALSNSTNAAKRDIAIFAYECFDGMNKSTISLEQYYTIARAINYADSDAEVNEVEDCFVNEYGLVSFDAIMAGLFPGFNSAFEMKDQNWDVPLHIACRYGSTELIQSILRQNPLCAAIKNKNGWTALDILIQRGYDAVDVNIFVEVLIAYPHAITRYEHGEKSRLNILDLLKVHEPPIPQEFVIKAIELRPDLLTPDVFDDEGQPPINIAISNCLPSRIIKALAEKQHTPSKTGKEVPLLLNTKTGDTPLHVALDMDRFNPEVANMIIAQNPLYLHAQNSDGNFPLDIAIISRHQKRRKYVESKHPYENNTSIFQTIEEEGVESYEIVFDPKTVTENEYDYVTFYKDETKSDFWGSRKYCGDSNWPGVGDRPPLKIPAGKFYLHFYSDGSNTEWGYKFHYEFKSKITELTPGVAEVNKLLQFYLQPPNREKPLSRLLGLQMKISDLPRNFLPNDLLLLLFDEFNQRRNSSVLTKVESVSSVVTKTSKKVVVEEFIKEYPELNEYKRIQDISIGLQSTDMIDFDYTKFCELMRVDPSPSGEKMFQCFDYDNKNLVDLREILIILNNHACKSLFLKLKFSFEICNLHGKDGIATRAGLMTIINANYLDTRSEMIQQKADEILQNFDDDMITCSDLFCTAVERSELLFPEAPIPGIMFTSSDNDLLVSAIESDALISKDVISKIIEVFPASVKRKLRDGNIPLVRAIEFNSNPDIIQALIDAYPQSVLHPVHRSGHSKFQDHMLPIFFAVSMDINFSSISIILKATCGECRYLCLELQISLTFLHLFTIQALLGSTDIAAEWVQNFYSDFIRSCRRPQTILLLNDIDRSLLNDSVSLSRVIRNVLQVPLAQIDKICFLFVLPFSLLPITINRCTGKSHTWCGKVSSRHQSHSTLNCRQSGQCAIAQHH